MIIINKNEGEKIPYEVTGTRICFDDELTVNLQKYEQDDPVHIDICYDRRKNLMLGTVRAKAYVAEIDIPARQYEPGEDGALTPVALDMDTVTLTLWAI